MDTKVPKDPGAGVGKAGVVTPWENGNRKNAELWNENLGTQGWEETDRKNSANTGTKYGYPWEEVCDYPSGGSKQ